MPKDSREDQIWRQLDTLGALFHIVGGYPRADRARWAKTFAPLVAELLAELEAEPGSAPDGNVHAVRRFLEMTRAELDRPGRS